MALTKKIQFLLFISLFQFSFQQSSNFLPNIIENVNEATVGYGNQAVDITHLGGSTLDDSTFHFESIEFENLESNEWTVQWTDTEGEDYHLIDENGHIIQVGPNNSTEDVTDELATAAGIPDSSVAGVIGILAEDLVQKVDEKGGNVTLTGNEVYTEAVGPVTIAVLNAKFSSSSIGSSLEDAGNAIGNTVSNGASDVKNAAEDVGETVSDAASNAWDDTKDAAHTVGDKASDVGNDIADKAQDVGESIANAATDFGENVSEDAHDAWNATKNAADTVGDKASDVGNDIADKAQDVGNSIANTATDFGENASNAANNAWDDTKNAADTVADKTKDAADQVGNAVSNAANSIKDGISSLFGN